MTQNISQVTGSKLSVPTLNTNKSNKDLLAGVKAIIEELRLKDINVDILKHNNGYPYARLEGPYLEKQNENKLRELVYRRLKIGIAYVPPYLMQKFASDIESIFKKKGFNISATLTREKWKNKTVIALSGEFPEDSLHKYLLTLSIAGRVAINNNFLILAGPVVDKDSKSFKLISYKLSS